MRFETIRVGKCSIDARPSQIVLNVTHQFYLYYHNIYYFTILIVNIIIVTYLFNYIIFVFEIK